MKNAKKILFLTLCAALILRIIRSIIDLYVDKDVVLYVNLAKDITEGSISDAFLSAPHMAPLFISLMALGEKTGLGAANTGLLLSLLSGVLLVLFVFLIARRLFSEEIALLASFLAATQPYLIRDSAEIMRDSLFMCLLFISLYFAIIASEKEENHNYDRSSTGFFFYFFRNDPLRFWYPCGFFAGLAVLTRSEGHEILATFLLWSFYKIALSYKTGAMAACIRRGIFSLAAILCGFLIVASPSQLILLKTSSQWCIVDPRIFGYIKSFIKMPGDEIIKTEIKN